MIAPNRTLQLTALILASAIGIHMRQSQKLIANSGYKVACLPAEITPHDPDETLLPNAHISHTAEYEGKSYICYFSFKQSPPTCAPAQQKSAMKPTDSYPSIKEGTVCFFPNNAHSTLLKSLGTGANLEDFDGKIVKDWDEAREVLAD